MYLTQPLHKARRERPGAIATIQGDRIADNATFIDRVARLAGALRALGVGPGDRVGMLALNSDRYIEFLFATLWAGGAVNPVNCRWSAPEIAFSLDDCDTRVLIVDDAFAPMVQTLRELSSSLKTVIRAGEYAELDDSHDYEALIAAHAPVEDALRRGDDLAAVLYTGGTTGRPKGVMLSHANFVLNSMGLGASEPHAGSTPALHVAPMFHVSGTAAAFQLAFRGAPQVVLPAFDPGEALRLIEKHRIGDVFLVPTMLRWMVDHPERPSRDTTSLLHIRYGAAPIDSKLLNDAMAAFPGVDFMQLYGQTECGPVVTALSPVEHRPETRNETRLRSAGRPIVTAEVRIVGADGAEAAVGAVGEIAVRGPSVMLGYWNRPEETAAALRDGWMHTGDAGTMDADGFVYVVDRVKDMIISGGENVYSAEVENALSLAPGVAACSVIAVPDEQWGERVHAVVVAAPGATLEEKALQDFCRQRIAGYKIPRSFEFVEALPLSPAGKVLKHVLRKPWWEDRTRNVG